LFRNTSGGNFNTIKSNFEYRENFKHSLRQYEKSTSRHRAPRPIFSAVLGQRKKNNRAYEDITKAFQEAENLRQSLNDEKDIPRRNLTVSDQAVLSNYNSMINKNQWNLAGERDILVDAQNTFPKKFMES
jgi:hypothetical protein